MKKIFILLALFTFSLSQAQVFRHRSEVKIEIIQDAEPTDSLVAIQSDGRIVKTGVQVQDIGGGGSTQTLQETTTAGSTTTDYVNFNGGFVANAGAEFNAGVFFLGDTFFNFGRVRQVGDGVDSGDAVNLGQLNTAIAGVSSGTTPTLEQAAQVGNTIDSSITLNGTTTINGTTNYDGFVNFEEFSNVTFEGFTAFDDVPSFNQGAIFNGSSEFYDQVEFFGDVDFSTFTITGVGEGFSPTDGVNLGQVQTLIGAASGGATSTLQQVTEEGAETTEYIEFNGGSTHVGDTEFVGDVFFTGETEFFGNRIKFIGNGVDPTDGVNLGQVQTLIANSGGQSSNIYSDNGTLAGANRSLEIDSGSLSIGEILNGGMVMGLTPTTFTASSLGSGLNIDSNETSLTYQQYKVETSLDGASLNSATDKLRATEFGLTWGDSNDLSFNMFAQGSHTDGNTTASLPNTSIAIIDASGGDVIPTKEWVVANNLAYLPVLTAQLYEDTATGDFHEVQEYSNTVITVWNQSNSDGSFTRLVDLPATYVLVPPVLPTLPLDTGGNVALDFSKDVDTFQINFRGSSNANKNVELFMGNVPYETIPNLVLPAGVTYTTGANADGTFNHLFTTVINGFDNPTNITSSILSPTGINDNGSNPPTIHVSII